MLVDDLDGFKRYGAPVQTVVIERLANGYGIALVGPTVDEPRSGCFIARSSRDGVNIGERPFVDTLRAGVGRC